LHYLCILQLPHPNPMHFFGFRANLGKGPPLVGNLRRKVRENLLSP
jgi:hypothetical protein